MMHLLQNNFVLDMTKTKIIKFDYPFVGDELKYKKKRKKSGAYKIVNGSDTYEIKYSKKSSTTVGNHSTVTDLAKFRGLSTSLPRSTAA
jgi:spermidine/putrescine-binding protein